MKKLFLLIAFFIGYELCAIPIFNYAKYKLYDRSEGLDNNTVSSIFQDKEGFLWLGTDIGLTRSDGVNFHHYPFGNDGGSLVTDIHQFRDSLLWCWSSNYETPVCFDAYHGRVVELKGLSDDFMQSLYDFCMIGGQIYALSGSGLVHISANEEDSCLMLDKDEIDLGRPVERAFTDAAQLYLLSGDRILVYSPDLGLRESISVGDLGIEDLYGVANIVVYGDYMIAYGQEMLPVCYDLKNKKARILNTVDPIVGIQQVSDECYIIATWNTISVMQFDGKNLVESGFTQKGLFDGMAPYAAIFRNRINEMYYDKRNEVLWVGVTGRGLMQISFRGDRVKRIEVPENVRMVNGMAQDNNGYIWLSTNTQGVFRSSDNILSTNMHFEKIAGMENGKYVLFQDGFGSLWFGDSRGNVINLNPADNCRKEVKIEYVKDGKSVTASRINALYLNSRNRLWIAAENGLFVYDVNEDAILAYMPDDGHTGGITSIYQDGGGNMWIGTEKGVCQAQRQGAEIFLTRGFEEKADVAATKVLALYVNRFNQVYASYEDKTIHIDAATKEVVSVLMLRRDYSNGHISCIVDDDDGCTWLGTAGGVVIVNNENLESYLYELPERYLQAHKLKSGELLWATSSGLVYFSPDNVKEWVSNRKLIVSDVEINYSNSDYDVQHNPEGPLRFGRNENNLHIYVSDLRFGASQSKIEYRLLPLEKGWNSTYGNYIALKDLKPGKYVLEMRNPNITGSTPPVTTLNFIIRRPWILSFWGILTLVAGLLVLSAASLLIVYLILRRKENLSNLENTFLGRINESIEREERAKLRGNLRYEILQNLRTPISLIIAPLREISKDQSVEPVIKVKLNLALLNSVIVQELCTRLEDLYLLEKENIWKVAPYQVSKISNLTVFPLKELFNVSRVSRHFSTSSAMEKVLWVDSVRISFLLRSLLVHVLVYLKYSGEIWMELKEGDKDGRNVCIFVISTKNGTGIGKERQFSLCGDYDKVATQKLLGWQYLQYVAEMHHAEVYFKESPETGLEVSLYLPVLGKEDWSGRTNVEFLEPVENETVQHAFEDFVNGGTSLDLYTADSEKINGGGLQNYWLWRIIPT